MTSSSFVVQPRWWSFLVYHHQHLSSQTIPSEINVVWDYILNSWFLHQHTSRTQNMTIIYCIFRTAGISSNLGLKKKNRLVQVERPSELRLRENWMRRVWYFRTKETKFKNRTTLLDNDFVTLEHGGQCRLAPTEQTYKRNIHFVSSSLTGHGCIFTVCWPIGGTTYKMWLFLALHMRRSKIFQYLFFCWFWFWWFGVCECVAHPLCQFYWCSAILGYFHTTGSARDENDVMRINAFSIYVEVSLCAWNLCIYHMCSCSLYIQHIHIQVRIGTCIWNVYIILHTLYIYIYMNGLQRIY